jgi:hypothetical protein
VKKAGLGARGWGLGKSAAVAAALLIVSAAARADSVFDHPASSAQLEKDLAAATATLRNAQTLRGAYRQEKKLHEVPKPLVAEGTFLFAREVGILWRTVKPFVSELAITRDQVVQREADGSTFRLAAEQQPGVRTVAGIFFAVFALDFDALGSQFDLFSRKARAGWELGLKPRAAGGPVRGIVVTGRAQVDRVRLDGNDGDVTDILLRDARASPAPPSTDELMSFRP